MFVKHLDLIIAGTIVALSTFGLSLSHTQIDRYQDSIDQLSTNIVPGTHRYGFHIKNHCLGGLNISSVIDEQSVIKAKGKVLLSSDSSSEPSEWELIFSLNFNALSQLYAGDLKLRNSNQEAHFNLKLSAVKPIKAELDYKQAANIKNSSATFEGPIWLHSVEQAPLKFSSGAPLYPAFYPHLTRWLANTGLSLKRAPMVCDREPADQEIVFALLNSLFPEIATLPTIASNLNRG